MDFNVMKFYTGDINDAKNQSNQLLRKKTYLLQDFPITLETKMKI
jgi:hypothetical protein